MKPLDVAQYRNLVILTGAGISVASGLRPFRGPGGLWEEAGTVRGADAATLSEDPIAVWQLFGPLRRQLVTAQPNAGHRKLAALEAALRPDQRFLLITQNIDGLHQRAGSQQVVELHGTVHRTRCGNAACALPAFEESDPHDQELPLCPRCGTALRLDIVLFGEFPPVEAERQVKEALRECDLFVAIGTSGLVAPAANFARSAAYAGARTILINLEPMVPRSPYFQEEYLGRAEDVLPTLW